MNATGKRYIHQPVNGNLEQWSRTILWEAENEPAASYFNGVIAADGGRIATSATMEASGEAAIFV